MQNAKDGRDLSAGDPPAPLPPAMQNGTQASSTNAQNGAHHPVSPAAPYDGSVKADNAPAGLFDLDSSAPGLQVDPDAHGEEDDMAASAYASNTYPRTEAAFQVEHPFDTMPDSATM